MRITIKVKTNAKKSEVERLDEDTYRVSVNAPPIDGKANDAIRELLAEFFCVAKSRVSIVRGEKGKTKLVEIENGKP